MSDHKQLFKNVNNALLTIYSKCNNLSAIDKYLPCYSTENLSFIYQTVELQTEIVETIQ